MDDQAGDAACEAVGEFPDHGAAPPVQHVDATVQVDEGQARMRGHKLQDILELVRRVGVHLGGHARLGEAEPSEFEQRLVPGDALLEQGMNGQGHRLPRGGSPGAGLAGTSLGTIHIPHSTASFHSVAYPRGPLITLASPVRGNPRRR